MKSLLFLLLALSLAACGDTPVSPEAPAEVPAPALTAARGTAGAGAFVRRALAVATVDDEIINEEGEISYSSDALGTVDPTGTIQVQKPAGGTLRKAVFAAASEPFTCTLENGLIRLDGTPISWDGSAAQQLPFGCGTNYHADVTDLIRMKLNAAVPGIVDFTVDETITGSPGIDGTALVVVWDDPAVSQDFSVVLLFGGQNTDGDNFRVNFTTPFGSGGIAQMSLAITFGYQCSNNGTQFSTVDVNGQRLTSSAGGEDDAESLCPFDGSLITMGGVGDDVSNPPPFGTVPDTPSGALTDDELYNLAPFLAPTTTFFDVFTRNPSDDDNIFLALFYMNPPGSVTATPGEEPPPDEGELACDVLPDLTRDLIEGVLSGFQLSPIQQMSAANVAMMFFTPFLNMVVSRLESGDLTIPQLREIIQNARAIPLLASLLTTAVENQIIGIAMDCVDA